MVGQDETAGSGDKVLAGRFDAFLLDLDGVVYLGDEPLPGSTEALDRLREAGKELRFLTNDPRPTREQLRRRLAGMDVDARREEVITSGWATARYLAREGIGSAYVIGSRGLASEIEAAGVEVVDRDGCDAVVVGSDEHVSYSHLRQASRHIFGGARFVATNADASFPSPKGPLPGTGAIVAAVRTTTGREPVVIGKPSAAMFDVALEGVGAERGRTVMIGDTPDSDIAGARRAGLASVLVRRKGERVVPAGEQVAADAVISGLSDLFALGMVAREAGVLGKKGGLS